MKQFVSTLSAILILFLCLTIKSNAQAVDFAQDDCDGQFHHLYSQLDSGKVVVMEFVMDCQLCVDGAVALDSLLSQFHQQYPGVIQVYFFAYSDLMDCNDMKAFRDSGNFQAAVFEENSHLMAHYGGFGMPTIGVAAGPAHLDIYSSVGFITADTAQLGTALRNYFATISVSEEEDHPLVYLFPSPVQNELSVITDFVGDTQFDLFNSSGSKVISRSLLMFSGQRNIIDLSEIPSGFYYARFASNNKSMVNKIVVVN